MTRIFRHKAERGWLELRRSPEDTAHPKTRLYPPQQVANRWEGSGGLEVLYELKSGDFVRVDFSADGALIDGYHIPRQNRGRTIEDFFTAHELLMPWHLSGPAGDDG